MIPREIKKYEIDRRENGFIYFNYLDNQFVCKVIKIGNGRTLMIGNVVKVLSYIVYPSPVHLTDESVSKSINYMFTDLINLNVPDNTIKVLIVKNKKVKLVKGNTNELIKPEDTVNGIHICTIGEFNNLIENYIYFLDEKNKSEIKTYHFDGLV